MALETDVLLDDPAELDRRDRDQMFAILGRFDQMLLEAVELVSRAAIPSYEGLQNVVLLGLGGSAIGGDLVRAFVGPEMSIPFVVSRGYAPPGFTGSKTLVIASSYSGDTEETLQSLDLACRAQAKVVCVTSGGELGRQAESLGLPVISLPAGLPPRMALPYSLTSVLRILSSAGIIAPQEEEITASAPWVRDRLRNYGPEMPLEENTAKLLAQKLFGRIPIVYGSQDRLEYVARRWASQFSENGKQLAYYNMLPEMNHNEIVGWKHPHDHLEDLVPVFLRDHQDHSRVQIRLDVTREIIGSLVDPVLEFWSAGEGWLERLWTLILLGDFASIYLAILNREDPTPVEAIEALKTRLRHY